MWGSTGGRACVGWALVAFVMVPIEIETSGGNTRLTIGEESTGLVALVMLVPMLGACPQLCLGGRVPIGAVDGLQESRSHCWCIEMVWDASDFAKVCRGCHTMRVLMLTSVG